MAGRQGSGKDDPEAEASGEEVAPSDFSGMRTLDDAELAAQGFGRTLSRALQPDQVFANRYVVQALIGEGGSGSVYRVFDNTTEGVVALKLLRTDRAATPDARKRLIREAVLARNIRHANVVAVYDVGEDAGQPYMAMEHLGGRSLRAWMRERLQSDKDCSFALAVGIVDAVLDGLEAAHELGVIHRDLKPENIFLVAEPQEGNVRLKLLDFGLARTAGQASNPSSGSTMTGTPHYMAPEQITSPDTVKASADLYSLSVLFYELLVGVLPQGHWQPPSRGRSDVPTAADTLIELGLSNRPRSRPQSVEAYRKELAAALAPAAKPEPPKPDKIKPEPAKPDTKRKTTSPPKPEPAADAMWPDVESPKPKRKKNSEPEREADSRFASSSKATPKPKTAPPGPEGTEVPDADRLDRMAEHRKEADRLYQNGKGFQSNFNEAREQYRKAGELGDPQASFVCGLMYERGHGGVRNMVEANSWYRRAAEKGHAEAQYNYALNLSSGAGVSKDLKLARVWYKRAADQGHVLAMNNLGVAMQNGEGGPVDYRGAHALYSVAAANGEAMAMYNLGRIADLGRLGVVDQKAAREWYKRAADGGFNGGMFRYGVCLENGVGGPQDKKEARLWYTKGAEAGHKGAMYNLALLLDNGEGGDKNPAAAREWYRRAAEAGEPSAMANLGVMLQRGEGGPKDEAAATEWYRKSAAAGDPQGMVNYGIALRDARGVARDEVQARDWFRKAVDQGHVQAHVSLAKMLLDAKGGPRDKETAKALLAKAAGAGHEEAKTLLSRMW